MKVDLEVLCYDDKCHISQIKCIKTQVKMHYETKWKKVRCITYTFFGTHFTVRVKTCVLM